MQTNHIKLEQNRDCLTGVFKYTLADMYVPVLYMIVFYNNVSQKNLSHLRFLDVLHYGLYNDPDDGHRENHDATDYMHNKREQ